METLEQKHSKIAELLKEKYGDDIEKQKDELELILGKGHRSIKALIAEQADKVLEEFHREEIEKTFKKIEETGALPVPIAEPVVGTGSLMLLESDKDIESFIEKMKRVERYAMKMLQSFPPEAFVIFNNIVCLRGGWVDKFITGLPLPIMIVNKKRSESKTDNGYKVIQYDADCVNLLSKMSVPIHSEESSEKEFYCIRKEGGKKIKLQPEQVNIRDVATAAERGLRKEAIKLLFGLRGLTANIAQKYGIKIDLIQNIKFEK